MNLARYLHTARYLKSQQIYGRLAFRLIRPAPDLSPAPPLRSVLGQWAKPASRAASLLGPDTCRFLNVEHEIKGQSAWNDPARQKLWLYNLHYFDDLNAEGAESRVDWHRALIARWIAENPPGRGNGWEPYPVSLRIVNWVKWTMAGNPLDQSWLQSLAVQARWLARRLETHLLGNHLFANAKALVFAGLYFSGQEAESWLARGLSILEHEVSEQILPDGGHFERSPMYHSIILEDLLDLTNILGAYGMSAPQKWLRAVSQMRHWLKTMCHPDGDIVLFNDAAFCIAAPMADLEAYAQRLGQASVEERTSGVTKLLPSGYLRCERGPLVAFLDVAPIGPDYLPGHAHADTLSFETSLYGQRLIVDSGTSCYGASDERLRQRSTAAHNTVTVDGQDSSEVWGGFRVARRAKPFELEISEDAHQMRVSCAHNGFRRLARRPVHRREWRMTDRELVLRDHIEGRFERATGRVHFHPEVSVTAEDSGTRGTIRLRTGETVVWHLKGGVAQLVPATYHPEFGISLPNQCLEVLFREPITEIAFAWK